MCHTHQLRDKSGVTQLQHISTAGLSNIPNSSGSYEHNPHDKENNITYDDESNWLPRNDVYQMQNIAGRLRLVPMAGGHKTQTSSTIMREISQGMSHEGAERPYQHNAAWRRRWWEGRDFHNVMREYGYAAPIDCAAELLLLLQHAVNDTDDPALREGGAAADHEQRQEDQDRAWTVSAATQDRRRHHPRLRSATAAVRARQGEDRAGDVRTPRRQGQDRVWDVVVPRQEARRAGGSGAANGGGGRGDVPAGPRHRGEALLRHRPAGVEGVRTRSDGTARTSTSSSSTTTRHRRRPPRQCRPRQSRRRSRRRRSRRRGTSKTPWRRMTGTHSMATGPARMRLV